METIDIEKLLIKPLYKRYKNSNQVLTKFNIALDIMEVSIKFITLLAISILKEIESKDYYENKILKSLNRDEFSLGNHYFVLQEFLKYEHKNPLLNKLKSILTNKEYSIKVEIPNTIWKAKNYKKEIVLHSFIKKGAKIAWIKDLVGYIIALRNKNAHTPTLNENNKKFIQRLFLNVESTLTQLEKITEAIFNIKDLKFYTTPFEHNDKYKELIAKYQYQEYNLSPLLIIDENFIYFLIFSENSKSEYIEYIQTNLLEINTKEDKWEDNSLEKSLKIFASHSDKDEKGRDGSKYKLLKSEFIGRDEEIEKIENHILENYDNNTLTIITGKPGIGKSAFVTELQSRIMEKKAPELISYLFYAIKEQNRENEFLYFRDKVKKFLRDSQIDVGKRQKRPNQLFAKVAESNKSFLLIIDGLDEFSNVIRFLQDMQFSHTLSNSKIHIVLTTRPYQNICNELIAIFKSSHNYKIYNHKNVKNNGYSFELGALKPEETKELIIRILPRDDHIAKNSYMRIIDEIVEKSGSLPIYIHYISKAIKKEKLGTTSNYITKLQKLASELPKTIEEYYIKTFREISPLGREILITISFSPHGISMRELYEIFRKKYIQIDDIEFENIYFASVELFLREFKKDYYIFYHLSIRDTIFQFYINKGDITQFKISEYIESLTNGNETLKLFFKDSGYRDELDHIFSFIFAIKSECNFNQTLKYIIDSSIEKLTNNELSYFLKKNFFYLYYNYCLFMIVSYNQDKIIQKEIEITPQIRKENKRFLEIFEKSGEKEDTKIISYAYQLSRLIGEHQKSIKYYEMYSSANLQTFIRICSDINHIGHIKEFYDKFEYWEQLDKSQQNILIDILVLNLKIDKSFRGIYERLDKVYQRKLDLIWKY